MFSSLLAWQLLRREAWACFRRSVTVVTGVGTLPAIEGAKSLLVPPGATVTLHLGRATNLRAVHFTTQALSRLTGFSAGVPPIEIATIGGTQLLEVPAAGTNVPPTETGDTAWPYAAAKQTYDLALVDSGTDIAVRIAPEACWGVCSFSPQALLIDDLWVE